ncbi:MAG TPA: hypothetical protein VER32_08665 [Pyrinomonadaceae bacterium]|nr:hypothetical protein [Pyrinomonadaceae bacterium]
MSRRHARRRTTHAARALLSVACLLALAHAARAKDSGGPPPSLALREKDVRRAEKVLEKLRRLDEAAARDDARGVRETADELYPGLFVTVSDMRPSDLKTDLDTAVFLYEEAVRTWLTTGGETADCGRERRGIYLTLCLDLGGGTRRQLLAAKARLHARFAEAVIRSFTGAGDAEMLRTLSAMKAARADDVVLAARVVETLKTLAELVDDFLTTDDEDGSRSVSRAAFDRLRGRFAEAVREAGALLAAMPRSPAFYSLSAAWRGFGEGLFWYQKVHHSKRLVVAAGGFDRDPLKDLRLDAEQVSHTVVASWDAAIKSTRVAERSLSLAAR